MAMVVHVDDAGLKQLTTDDRNFNNHIRTLIGKYMRKARNNVSRDARGNMESDPRQAYKAVKHTVYRGVLGGNISILQKRKASNVRGRLERQRKIDQNPHQRGGNRIKRVEDGRNRLDTYIGSDRGFALRFGQGTTQRSSRYGNRGAIRGRRWFEVSATYQLSGLLEQMNEDIAREIEKKR